MAQSSAVLDGNTALAEEYNDLRNDVLSTTLGHLHDGTNGREPGDQQQKLRNPADTFSYTIRTSAIAAARDLTIPLLTANDTLAVLGLAQTFTAQQTFNDLVATTVDINGGTIDGVTIGAAAAPSQVRVQDNALQVENPAATFVYTITGAAIAAARQLNLPLTTATDTLAVLGLAQTFTAQQTFNDLVATTVDINGGTIDGVTIGAAAAPSQVRVQDNALQVENPAATFVYTITGAAIAAARQLNLPLTTATDTLAVLGLAQTFSAQQTFSASIDVTGGTVQNSTGNLTLSAAAGADVLIGDDTTILYMDGGTGGVGVFGMSVTDESIRVRRGAVTAGANNNFTDLVVSSTGAVTIPAGTSTYVGTAQFNEPNITATGTVTNAFTLRVVNAPTEGTNNYAIWVDDGLVQVDRSIVVGAPTGGDKGAGTINAQAVYDDNVLLTDYVFEPGYNMLPVPQMVEYFGREHHLPTIPGRAEWEKRGQFSVGQLGTHLWETVEVHARYIGEHEARFSTIEDRVDAVKEANEILRQQLVDANLIPEA